MTEPPTRTSTGRRFLVAVLLAVVALAVYAPARHHGFLQLDDNEYVTENAAVRSGLNRQSVRWAFTAYHSGHWHPATWLSLMADCQRAGVDPGAMHTTNIVLHALAVVLLFLAFEEATGRAGRSAFVAALFALHPLRVESVAWIAARKDVLSGLFLMLLLWTWVRYARRGSPGLYALALVAYACALLAKPTLAVVPFGLLLLDWWPLGRLASAPAPEALADGQARRTRSAAWLLAEKLPLFALAALTLTQTWAAQRAAGAVAEGEGLTLAVRLGNALWNYGLYLARSAWPFDLGVFYPLAPVPVEKAVAVAVLLALATFVAVRERERRPWLVFGWLWFAGTLVPVSGIVQFGGQAMADRYSYIPHIGLFVAVTWEASDRFARSTLPRLCAPVAGAVVLALAAWLTSSQLAWWKDSVTLLSRTVAVTRGNFLAHNNLGVALEKLGRWDEAAGHYEEAARLNPGWPEAQNNYGIVLAKRGRMDEAIARFEQAIRVRPGFARAHNNLGTALSSIGRHDEAMERFTRAVELDPDYVDARLALGQLLERRGDLAAAEAHYAAVLARAPRSVAAAQGLERVRQRRSSGTRE